VSVVGSCAGALLAAWLDGLLGAGAAVAPLGVPALGAGVFAQPALQRLDRELAEPAAGVPLLRGLGGSALLPTPQLEAVALRLVPVTFPAGADVVVQGEPGDDHWVVEQGRLSVHVDGRQVTELGPGEGFGELALLRNVLRTATVTARSSVELQRLGRHDLLAAVSDRDTLSSYQDLAQMRLHRAAPLERWGIRAPAARPQPPNRLRDA
jgi:CRP-like cAMP-binding protein